MDEVLRTDRVGVRQGHRHVRLDSGRGGKGRSIAPFWIHLPVPMNEALDVVAVTAAAAREEEAKPALIHR